MSVYALRKLGLVLVVFGAANLLVPLCIAWVHATYGLVSEWGAVAAASVATGMVAIFAGAFMLAQHDEKEEG